MATYTSKDGNGRCIITASGINHIDTGNQPTRYTGPAADSLNKYETNIVWCNDCSKKGTANCPNGASATLTATDGCSKGTAS